MKSGDFCMKQKTCFWYFQTSERYGVINAVADASHEPAARGSLANTALRAVSRAVRTAVQLHGYQPQPTSHHHNPRSSRPLPQRLWYVPSLHIVLYCTYALLCNLDLSCRALSGILDHHGFGSDSAHAERRRTVCCRCRCKFAEISL